METTVEGFCNAMSRCHFLPAERIRDLRQRWRQQGSNTAGRVEDFTAWLVANHVATDYQVGVLGRGNGEQLFLGPYRILERIGRGRMAGVYKATHNSGMTVAIKVLPPSKAAQPPLLARFQREVKLAMLVKHPNVVQAFHTGEQRSLHYLVMEHLEGETLAEVLHRPKRLPVSEAVALLYQAFLGLQAIHEQGLVHRDLSPGNLMLIGGEPYSTVGALVKILDLGLGRALFDDAEDLPGFDLTRPGEMLGTSDYMSPEQAMDSHNIDIRTDVYALGCVLYHALAGESPFADVNPVRQLLRHATEEPQPITQRNPEVPAALEQILKEMMAKDPAKRCATPARAAQALEMFVAANTKFAPRPDVCLDAYLEWVSTCDGSQNAPPAAPPSRPAAVPAPPPPAPPAKEPRVVEVMAQRVPEAPAGVSSRPPPLPSRERVASPPARSRRENERDKEKPEPRRSRPTAGPRKEEEEPAPLMGMKPRELLILTLSLLGVIGMSVLGLLGFVLYRAFR